MQSSSAQHVLESSPDTVLETPLFARPLQPSPDCVPTLQFSRTDLEFRFDADGTVDISLHVTNPGPGMSPPRRGRVEVAAFGAFLPWQPLTTFRVPRLRPGESTFVKLRVPRTALGGDLPPEPPREPKFILPLVARQAGVTGAFRALMKRLTGMADDSTATRLAGNLNVHIGKTSVERHLSGALRLYAGVMNMAFFYVGTGDDEYRFEVRADDPTWQPSLRHQDMRREIIAGEWYSLSVGLPVTLAVSPPPECRRGGVEVHVEQRSSGRIAVVEFDLDQKALGAGCYTV